MFQNFMLVGAVGFAGAMGTLARWGLTYLTYRACGSGFPWGTLVVNASGCLLIGFIAGAALSERGAISPEFKLMVMIGFLGAFTTFSTFALETGLELEKLTWSAAALAMTNVAAQNVGGVVLVIVGLALGRLL